MFKYLWISLLWLPTLAYANHCRNSISGTVIDSETRAPLPYANIFIVELKDGVVADGQGKFRIEGLCEGTFTLKVSHIGCTPVQKAVTVDGEIQVTITMDHSMHTLQKVNVVGKQQSKAAGIGSSSLKPEELDQGANMSLGAALTQINGLTTLATGNNVQKPAIHGLTGNRVGIYNNGVKLESQMWGSEHAPEVGLFGAQNVTLYKGVSAIKYGGDALAGVVKIEAPKAPNKKGLSLALNTAYNTNNKGISNGLRGVFNTGGTLAIEGHFAGQVQQNGNYQSPQRYLTNTGGQTTNLKYGLARNFNKHRVEVFYSNFQAELGILDGSHVGNLTDLFRVIEAGEAPSGDTFTYAINKPKQNVFHEMLGTVWKYNLTPTQRIQLRINRQYNLREEFDRHGPKGINAPQDIPAIQFELTTWTAELDYQHTGTDWQYEVGLQGNRQKNTFEGTYFIPGFYRDQLGVYGLYSKRFAFNTSIELGARLDYSGLQAFNARNIGDRDTTLQFLVPTFHAQYTKNWSKLKASVQSGFAWRPPAANELFAQGLHHASARVETGDASLDAERAVNNGLELEYSLTPAWTASALLYANYYFNFIYLAPLPKAELTIRGAFPSFLYQQAEVWHRGIDFSTQYQLDSSWRLEASAATVFISEAGSGNALPNIPADRCQLKTYYQPKKNQFGLKELWVAWQWVGQQNRIPPFTADDASSNAYLQNLLQAPVGYHLLSAGLSGQRKINKDFQLQYYISGTNLLNRSYRDYTNAFRFFAAEMGRNITLGLSLKFNS